MVVGVCAQEQNRKQGSGEARLHGLIACIIHIAYSDRPGRQDPVFPQQLINNHAARGGDIERMFAAEHGNAHVGIAQSQQRIGQAIHFMPEQNADREARLPIVQVGGVNAGFDGGDFVALLAETQDERAQDRRDAPRERSLRRRARFWRFQA